MTPIDEDSAIFEFLLGPALPPVPPGATIADELRARGLSAHRAALMMRIPPGRLGQIVAGKRAISADTALRLGILFGTGAQLWMNLQSNYDLSVAERDHGAEIAAQVEAA